MSAQTFQDFLNKLQQDSGLQRELQARFGDIEQGIPTQELLDFAATRGYQYAVSEAGGELSDQQLEAVAGGAGSYYKLTDQLISALSIGGGSVLKFNSAWKFTGLYKP